MQFSNYRQMTLYLGVPLFLYCAVTHPYQTAMNCAWGWPFIRGWYYKFCLYLVTIVLNIFLWILLQDLPNSIGKLKSLHNLNVDRNRLTEIPVEVYVFIIIMLLILLLLLWINHNYNYIYLFIYFFILSIR